MGRQVEVLEKGPTVKEIAELIHFGMSDEEICEYLSILPEDIVTREVRKEVVRLKVSDIKAVKASSEGGDLLGIQARSYWMKHIHGWCNEQAAALALKTSANKSRNETQAIEQAKTDEQFAQIIKAQADVLLKRDALLKRLNRNSGGK